MPALSDTAPETRPNVELHVLPHPVTGRWQVRDADRTVSWYSSADAAARSARHRGARVYLHDRYQRVRRLDP
jgi:hypothetical protein